MADESSFLSRWSQRKARVRQGGEVPAEPPAPSPVAPVPRPVAVAPGPAAVAEAPAAALAPTGATTEPASEPSAEAAAPPAPTLADVAVLDPLDPQADFTRFVAPGVDSGVKNAALKKLFTDPHFNVMDGLDVYIDDYGQPDPLPAGMLRQMAQSQFLGLFTDEKAEAAARDSAGAAAVTPASAAGETPAPPPPATPPDRVDPEAAGECPTIENHENADLRLQPHDDAGRAGAGPNAEPDPGRER